MVNIPLLSRFVCVLGFFFWCVALTIKYYSFGYYDWDLALYSQTMWALCHGTTMASLFGTSFLADHAHYIAFLITPIYFIFPHPLTLIYLEVFSFFAGAYILFKLAQNITTETIAFTLMIMYILHPANIFMLMYEFHFESIGLGLIFLLFYFHPQDRYKAFMITALLLMLIKENMPLIVLMIGVYGLFSNPAVESNGHGPLVLGLSMFMLTLFIFTPLARHGLHSHQNVYWGNYHALGNSPTDILKNLFLNPGLISEKLFILRNLYYICIVSGGFLWAALFCPSILLLSTPLFLQNLLSSAMTQHTIFFHYSATIIPFISIAAVFGFSFIKKKFHPWFCHLILGFSLLMAVISFMKYGPLIKNRIDLVSIIGMGSGKNSLRRSLQTQGWLQVLYS